MATKSFLSDPAVSAFAVTKSDTVDFAAGAANALYVGTAGDVVVVLIDGGAAITFTNVQNGSILPVRCRRVNSTNTTASNIVALQ